MNYINIDLTNNTSKYPRVIGGQGEQKITGLKIVISEEYNDWTCYFDFKNPEGEKYRRISNSFTEGIATYEFDAFDTKHKGNILIDLVLIKDEKVAKPFSDTFAVKGKVCAENAEEEFIPIILTPDAILSTNDIDNLLGD